jgi:hypothetical protein
MTHLPTWGVTKDRKIAVVTGVTEEPLDTRLAHPKIQTVALEQGERPGLADRFDVNGGAGKPLFATAIQGGLANYWGQQFVRYGVGDPYPGAVFPSYQAYVNDCAAIERFFKLEGGDALAPPARLPDGFSMLAPRLLTGTEDAPAGGLTSMRRAITTLLDGAHVFPSRAERFAPCEGALWSLRLSDGRSITASKIFLAAGVLGTAKLVITSFQDMAAAFFSDHAPYMLYTRGWKSLCDAAPANRTRHFNALTIEKQFSGRCEMFASVYNMGAAELNLLLVSVIGRAFSFLRGFSAPPGASLIQPVQVWTQNSFADLQMEARTQRITSVKPEHEADPVLEEFRAMLKGLGVAVLHRSRTAPGAGFHYHALTLRTPGGKTTPIANLLKERSGGAVACVDASILPSIGLRPHTLTAMATARRLTIEDQSLQ